MIIALTGFGLLRRHRVGFRSTTTVFAASSVPVPAFRRGHSRRRGGASSVVVLRLRPRCKAMACSVLP